MPDTSAQYEKRLNREIAKVIKAIQDIYYKSIQDISIATYMRYGNLSGATFQIDNYLKRALDNLAKDMHDNLVTEIVKAVSDTWNLSNEKNDQIATDIIQKVFPELINNGVVSTLPGTSLIFNPNRDALKAFISRTESGMNLSKRVWNLIKPYRFELEAGLTDGINKGLSAANMANNLKKYLQEPDKLFRRVRDENGKLQLSKAARDYHPGQGVYRSSFQNAIRLTASETNMSYRTADHNRWENETFVKGIEVVTSDNHPKYDICDEMAGKYPKDFHFRGWHPRCRCHAIPILMTDEEFSKQEDVLLGIRKKTAKVKMIEKIPASAKAWLQDNAERIDGWKNTPYFIADNPQYL